MKEVPAPLKTTPPWNVLVFPAASEIGLEIHRALSRCKEVILHGANQPGASIAQFHFKHLHDLPSIHDADCLPQLQKLIAKHQIDAIFPAYDDIVVWLAQHADQLSAAVITSPLETCLLCRSKSATYAKMQSVLPVPRLWDVKSGDISFPVFVKPDKGQGSEHARRIDNKSDLTHALLHEQDLITMEYLPGDEYTVDCFSTRADGLLYAKARRRLQTKTGIATLTETVDVPQAREWAEIILRHMSLRGAWFFQMKADAKGHLRLLEIAPRIAGSMALTRALGPNFPLLSLYEAAGVPLAIQPIDDKISMVMGRSLDVRFAHTLKIDALYIDLDDTLILRGAVNTQLIALIFHYRNRGIPVHLITRHGGDIDATLAKFRLTSLFDSVRHIKDASITKASLIKEAHAVLIDDSFSERRAAANMGNILCFDAANAVCLFDDRQ